MSGAMLDLGAQLDEFIREFDCDPAAKDTIYSILATASADDAKKEGDEMVQRVCAKLIKKRSALGTDFSELVEKIKHSDLKRPDQAIAFVIARANAQSKVRTTQRKAKLVALNDTANQSSVFSLTSSPKIRVQKCKTPASALRDGPELRFIDVDAKQDMKLSGRAKIRTVVNERDLMAELLSALVGLEGRYIKRNTTDGLLNISQSCSIADIQHSQFLRILPLGDYYVQLQRASQRSSSNLIIQAFYSCIPELLTQYSTVISDLYSKLIKPSATLTPLEIMVVLHDWQVTMYHFLSLSEKSLKCGGIQLANAAYAMYCGTVSESLINRSLEFALKAMLAVFHESLRHWLFYGGLKHNSEWMIAVEGDCSMKNPWTTRYKIFENGVPLMFSNFDKLSKKILMIGRSVGLLCSLKVDDRFLKERKRVIDSMGTLDFYLDVTEATRFAQIISRIYNQMNGEVIHEMFDKYRTRDHLEAVKKHFFLTDECFARTFYNQVCEAVEDDLLKLDSQRACQALTEALALCSSFPVELTSNARLEATCGLMEEGGQVLPSPRDASGYPTIRLRYITSIPISIIFSESTMHRYDRIFRFIWQIVCVDLRLTEVTEAHGILHKAALHDWPEFLKMCRLFSAVFVRMAYLLNIQRSYINAVIDQCTKKFAVEFEGPSCGDLARLIEAHKRYLSSVEDCLFLSEDCKFIRTAILATLDSVMDAVRGYKKFKIEFKNTLELKIALDAKRAQLKGSSLEETKLFEIEEEAARLTVLQESLVNAHRPFVKNTNAKFELLIKDVASGISNVDRTPHSLLLQHLSFGNFC